MQYENITEKLSWPLLLGRDPNHDVRYGSHINKGEKTSTQRPEQPVQEFRGTQAYDRLSGMSSLL